MATTDFCTTPTAGINFNRRTTTKEFGLGTVVHGTVNTIWIYVHASEVVATGTCTVTGTTLTDAAGNFTADTAFASGEYGWVRRTTVTVA